MVGYNNSAFKGILACAAFLRYAFEYVQYDAHYLLDCEPFEQR